MRHLVELRGGPTVVVRPATAADGPAVTAYLERLSDHSRYLRFLQATPRIRGRLVEMFTTSEADRRLVLVAVLGDEIVGEAMLVADRHDSRGAEIAYSVADGLRRRGLARAMTDVLLDVARRWRVCWLRADMVGENRASANLLRSVGASIRFEDGLLVARLDLRPPARSEACPPLLLAC
jgi:GNAT superfamily N-acetyltransferase